MLARFTYETGRIRDTPWVNVALGTWLFMSAFLWHHTSAERIDTWVVGALCVALALVATRIPAARWGNVALGAWLFVSVWALPHDSEATFWNNAAVAMCVLMLALDTGVPADEVAKGPRRVLG